MAVTTNKIIHKLKMSLTILYHLSVKQKVNMFDINLH